ncbi:MAG TPA: hypothetical protein VG937_13920 [Polyangiaceae bacterium]|nr:hypothetical protein [Polyangiaceae bacterium]
MSDPGEPDGRPSAPELDASGEQAVRELLRGAIPEPEALPDLTLGVQQKLRVRSGGKFYADGWSTVKHPPLNTYLITSLMMLFVSCVIYALLAPLSGAPEIAKPPKPVTVVPTQ